MLIIRIKIYCRFVLVYLEKLISVRDFSMLI